MSDWNLGLDPTPATGTDPNEAMNRINFHDHGGAGKGEPIDSQYIINTPAGNITATNTQAAIAELNVLANLGRVHVPVRQTVLHGYTNGVGRAAFLQQGSGLSVNLLATSTPLIIAFAYNFDPIFGQLDYIGSITEDVPSAWSALPPNQTCYFYVDRNIDTGVLTCGYNLFAPVYQNLAPETPLTDQHWFDLNTYYMKRYSGTAWENKQRVFVGECTTGADSVTSVTTYALQGKSVVDSAPLAANQLQTIPHNIGKMPTKRDMSLVCVEADQGWAVGDEIIINPNYYGATPGQRYSVGVGSKNITTIVEGDVVAHNKTTKAYAVLTLNKWKFRIRCEA